MLDNLNFSNFGKEEYWEERYMQYFKQYIIFKYFLLPLNKI